MGAAVCNTSSHASTSPILFPLLFYDQFNQPFLVNSMLDIGSTASFISSKLLQQLGIQPKAASRSFSSINDKQFHLRWEAVLQFHLPAERRRATGSFFVADQLLHPLIIGLPEAASLPLSVVLDGKPVFTGFSNMEPIAVSPTLSPGEGVQFAGGSAQQQQQVIDLLLKYQANIYEWSGKLGMFREHVVSLPLKDTTPVAAKPYRVGPDKRAAFRDLLDSYLQQGFIEPSNSLWGSPAFLVPKKVAPGKPPKWRLVEDYRAVNEKLQDLPNPVPSVQQLLDDLGPNASFYAVLDMTSGYHHCPLATSARPVTAFVTPEGVFQYRVLPFGLKVAPQLFQQALQHILKAQLHRACLVYLDDIIVFGDSFEQFIAHLQEVLDALTRAGGCLGIAKCQFLAQEIQYLGRRISAGKVRPSKSSVQAVLDFPQPSTKVALQRFLGLATYVRQFVDHFADLEQQLRTAIPGDASKNTSLQWSAEAISAFEQIKQLIAKHESLAVFNPDAQHLVLADASAQALGAVLLQQHTSGLWQPVEYASRVLTSTETRYSNTERELLAVTWAVSTKFRPYLEGRHFIIGTDHKALTGHCRLRPETARIVRLLLLLAPFSYKIQHVPGRQMQVADALSRGVAAAVGQPQAHLSQAQLGMPPCLPQTGGTNKLVQFQCSTHVAPVIHASGIQLQEQIQGSSDAAGTVGAQECSHKTKQGVPPCLAQTGGTGRLEAFQLNPQYIETKLNSVQSQTQVPGKVETTRSIAAPLQPMTRPEIQQQIMAIHRDHCHANWKKTYHHVREVLAVSGLRQLVWQTVLCCPECIAHNPPSGHIQAKMESVKSQAVNEVMVIDVLGPIDPPCRGMRYALLTIDHFSRFATVHPMTRPTVRCIIKALSDVFQQLGSPQMLVSDPATQFRARRFKAFINKRQVNHHLGSKSTFRATSVVERLARTLKTVAAKLQGSHLTMGLLETAILQYNQTQHGATKQTPHAVFFGSNTPVLQKPSSVKRGNRGRVVFQPGDSVLHFSPLPSQQRHAANRHLRTRARGPYFVIEQYPFNRYLVTDGFTQKVFPAVTLRLAPLQPSFSGGGRVTSNP